MVAEKAPRHPFGVPIYMGDIPTSASRPIAVLPEGLEKRMEVRTDWKVFPSSAVLGQRDFLLRALDTANGNKNVLNSALEEINQELIRRGVSVSSLPDSRFHEDRSQWSLGIENQAPKEFRLLGKDWSKSTKLEEGKQEQIPGFKKVYDEAREEDLKR